MRSRASSCGESRSSTTNDGGAGTSGTDVSVRLSSGSDGCDPKGFSQHRNTEQYPCADQPFQPCGKAGSRPRSV